MRLILTILFSCVALLGSSFDERFKWEKKHIHPVKLTFFKDSWVGKKPYFGIYAPTIKPWFLKSADEFRAPAQ